MDFLIIMLSVKEMDGVHGACAGDTHCKWTLGFRIMRSIEPSCKADAYRSQTIAYRVIITSKL